jgi:hypothetical protein
MQQFDAKRISSMFDYLSTETPELQRADGAFVFGRADPLVAERVAGLYNGGLIDYVMIVGGIGKDSGWLTDFGIPEATYQGVLLVQNYGFPPEDLYLEQMATNGGECCRGGIEKILGKDLSHNKLIIVAHATSLRRVEAMLKVEGPKKGFNAVYQRTRTRYRFYPGNPADQREAVAELLRLADWPAKGWCAEQEDLPEDLVRYARELKTAWKTD